jgi:hypothetical protein
VPFVWTAESEDIRNGRRVLIKKGGQPVSFRKYLHLLAEDPEFDDWYTELLDGTDFAAFFWEHPPICKANVDIGAEFVLIESSALAALRPDPGPFSSYFDGDEEVVSFRSLGGDAILIVPTPSEPLAACAHLASFVRDAPRSQVNSLWRTTGQTVLESLHEKNLWISTSGLGVSWLHIRLDSYPKYYQHLAYREIHGAFGLR